MKKQETSAELESAVDRVRKPVSVANSEGVIAAITAEYFSRAITRSMNEVEGASPVAALPCNDTPQAKGHGEAQKQRRRPS